MKKNLRKIIAALIGLLGIIMAIYVGGYLLLFCPLRNLYHCYINNSWTIKKLFFNFIKIFFSATAGGGIWCIFDIIAGFFRDDD